MSSDRLSLNSDQLAADLGAAERPYRCSTCGRPLSEAEAAENVIGWSNGKPTLALCAPDAADYMGSSSPRLVEERPNWEPPAGARLCRECGGVGTLEPGGYDCLDCNGFGLG